MRPEQNVPAGRSTSFYLIDGNEEEAVANGHAVEADKENGVAVERNGAGATTNGHSFAPMSPPGFHDGLLLSTSPFCTSYHVEKRARQTSQCSPNSGSAWRVIAQSESAENTVNPIRRIVDVMNVEPNPCKNLLKLHLGDPTLTGALNPPESVVKAVADSVLGGLNNGYGPAVGQQAAREAVASFAAVSADDVVLASGCSHALQMAIEVLANDGDNILVPRPGFPLYQTLMRPLGIEDRAYPLLIERGWEADLVKMQDLIDNRTRAIVVNNPSNPCGAVFSKQHLQDILEVASMHKLPIIADEIYGDLTWDDAVFHPLSSLEPRVPILTCDGIAKRCVCSLRRRDERAAYSYLVPGWRLGWVVVHDVDGALSVVRQGLKHLAQKIVGPCALVQGALPAILRDTPASFFAETRAVLAANARAAYGCLQGVPGLCPVRSYGAMYMMVGVDAARFPRFVNAMEMVKGLICEESVYCLPGSAFNAPDAFRLVLTYPEDVTREACERIRAFCVRHYSLRSASRTSICEMVPPPTSPPESDKQRRPRAPFLTMNDRKYSVTQFS